ncbi:hypothetical protein [Streptomyces thermovulgaris]|uniref:hypothetical protein n=1 Tax=Streptomyces thermovulgaris TaxID=1934 RepID=UPI000A39FD5C|nr:hypothetical protein [Streptomyces thermovulgaris]
MSLSAEVLALCRAAFAPGELELALRALETYGAEQADRVHRNAIRMSEGRLHRLAGWSNVAEDDPETFLWYAEDPEGAVRPRTREFAVGFMSGFADRHLLEPRGPRTDPGASPDPS